VCVWVGVCVCSMHTDAVYNIKLFSVPVSLSVLSQSSHKCQFSRSWDPYSPTIALVLLNAFYVPLQRARLLLFWFMIKASRKNQYHSRFDAELKHEVM